jgi:hypothetical protein
MSAARKFKTGAMYGQPRRVPRQPRGNAQSGLGEGGHQHFVVTPVT